MVLCVLVYYSQHPLRTLTSFFFQAEEGIRDGHVTGVQTCALPISRVFSLPTSSLTSASDISSACASVLMAMNSTPFRPDSIIRLTALTPPPPTPTTLMTAR